MMKLTYLRSLRYLVVRSGGTRAPVNLTKIGNRQKTVFRYIKLDPEERSIDPNKEMMLSAFKRDHKAIRFLQASLKDGKLTKYHGQYRFSAE